METALARLDAWLARHAPPLRRLLNPPASDADMAAFETRTGVTLPPDLRRLYAVHDGEATDSDGLFGCQRWLPLEEVARDMAWLGAKGRGVAGAMPFLLSGGGDRLYVRIPDGDGEGGPGDRRVYERWHEAPFPPRVVADSLEAWLEAFVARLEAGGFVHLDGEVKGLVDRRDLGEG